MNYKENGRPLLGWAAQNGNVAIVDALLKAGANPNIPDEGVGQTPLMRAIETQQVETVHALLKGKADPNGISKEGKSCLVFAVESRKPEIVQALVDAHADVKRVSKDGDSPALVAAIDGMPESLEIIRILGKAAANLNSSNLVYTPLVYAIQQGNKDLVKTLLEAGADPNARTQSGLLPIQAAFDNIEILELLVNAKADVNATTSSKGTPLLDAVQNSNADAVKTLLRLGADPKTGDANGNTPLSVAESNYQTEIAQLIKQRIEATTVPEENSARSRNYALEAIPVDRGSPTCTVVDAAKQQMELHRELQAKVDAGKMNVDIFRTFGEDTKDYGRMLTENPPEACALFARLRKKYGL